MGCCVTKYETKVATFENVFPCRDCAHGTINRMPPQADGNDVNVSSDVCGSCKEKMKARTLERANKGGISLPTKSGRTRFKEVCLKT